MRFCAIQFILILFCFSSAKGQALLENVDGLPTKEIYDLHVDKKGYLWIAHSLGVSRYDGLNFIHFTNPALASLQTTDIVEDRHGRIWCHNFSGQILYVEQGKLKFLESYNYKNENQLPHMALCGDELVVTSQAGLFVYSTITLTGKYIPFEKVPGAGSVSLSVVGNKTFVYNQKNWYLYETGSSIHKLTVDPDIKVAKGNVATLQPASYHDTIFLVTNPEGSLQKLVLQNDTLRKVGKVECHDYINAVTVDSIAWIHTRNKSITIDGAKTVRKLNLTDVVTGKEGNTWYSSFKKGLMIGFRPRKWDKVQFPIDSEDFVRSLNVRDGYFFAGTQNGYLVAMNKDNNRLSWKHNMFNGYGSIDFIRFFKNHNFIVGTSTNTYLVNPLQKRIINELPLGSINDVDFDQNSLYLATSNGCYVLPDLDSTVSLSDWQTLKQQQFPFYRWDRPFADNPYIISSPSCKAVRFDKSRQSLFISTKDGLRQVTQKGMEPFYINGKEVYASSLWYEYPRLYVATINDGLWIKEHDSLEHFTTSNYLFSNTIICIKVTENHLWLLENNGIQVFDIKSDKILQYIDLPKIIGSDVFDVAEKDEYAYLTTANGVYKIPMNITAEKTVPLGYLDYVVVDNRDTLVEENVELPHDKNDIQFFFSSPAFYNPKAISFKYRLVGDDDEWQITKPDERMLRFSSLSPGTYTFEAIAISKDGIQQEKPFTFRFVILQPWWNHWWIVVLGNAFMVAIVIFLIRNKMRQRLKVELVRQGIARDLHDDIGATLSSVNIYTELAKDEIGENEYLERIKGNIDDAVTRLRDLVWSINPKNDTMLQLAHRMQYIAEPLFKAAGIKCHFTCHRNFLDLKLTLSDKRNIYLLFKEMVNNVVKHARCYNCYINIKYISPYLILSVEDDGIGFDPVMVSNARNGLHNMHFRARQMNGTLHINSSEEKGSSIVVQLKAK
jgi:signal transduction histidine kinase